MMVHLEVYDGGDDDDDDDDDDERDSSPFRTTPSTTGSQRESHVARL
jgi:hypothetical protein